MPTYTYKAITSDGQTVSGALQAESQALALRMLDEQSLFPVNVTEGGGAAQSVITGRKRRVKLKHQTTFYTQLSDLLRAGVPLLRSLDVLSKQHTNAILAEVLREVRDDISAGTTLADAMSKHPHAFSTLHVSMIRAGEAGGFLEDALSRIATFAERQDELRNKLLGSSIYPIILMVVGTTIVVLLMVYLVPTLRKFIPEESWNIMSRIVFTTSDFLIGNITWILGLIIAISVAVYMYAKTESGRVTIDRLKLQSPIVGPVVTMVGVCRFCRILGTLLANGVPILDSLQIARESAGNIVLSEQIGIAADNVQRGETLSKPLGESGYFPPDIIDMMAVAEESNNLENVLVQIAETNEARTARAIDLAVRLIEPILLLVMALVVLCVAMALILPILTMASKGMR